MSYSDFIYLMFQTGFQRIERDDRLLDVFAGETLEKGVELWEKWNKKNTWLARVRLPFNEDGLELYRLQRQKIEASLLENKRAELLESDLFARGSDIAGLADFTGLAD